MVVSQADPLRWEVQKDPISLNGKYDPSALFNDGDLLR